MDLLLYEQNYIIFCVLTILKTEFKKFDPDWNCTKFETQASPFLYKVFDLMSKSHFLN